MNPPFSPSSTRPRRFGPLWFALVAALLFLPASASAAFLTFLGSWTDGNYTQETWRNNNAFLVSVTLRYTEGNSNEGETYGVTWTVTLANNQSVGPYQYEEDGAWRRIEIISDAALYPPSITSATNKAATQGDPVTYAITVANSANSYSATNLPTGLVLNTTTGVISGTPAVSGTIASTISATNAGGTSTATLTWTITGVSDVVAPSVPANVQAANAAFTALTLSWSAATDNIGVTGYEVRRNGVTVGAPPALSLAQTGLTPGTSYSFSVRARDAAGNWSAWSTPVSFSTAADLLPPSVPTNLAASVVLMTSFDLAWTASTDNHGIVGYDVRANGTIVTSPTGPFFAFIGLDPYTSYLIEVRARDLAGNVSGWSAPITVITMTTESLTYVGYSSGSFPNDQGTYWSRSWRNNTTRHLRVYYRWGLEDDEYLEEHNEVEGVAPGAMFYENGEDRYSPEDDNYYSIFRVITKVEAEGPILGDRPPVVAATGVMLTYTIGGTGMPASYSASGLPPGLSVNTTTGVISGAPTTAGSYNSTIRATNSYGTGVATLVWNVIVDTTPPSVPAGLSVAQAGAGQFGIHWGPSTDNILVTGYEVRQNGVNPTAVAATVFEKSFSLGTAAATHTFEVRARDSSGNWSNWCPPFSVPVYSVSIEGGTAGQSIAIAGTVVQLTADAAPSGKYFAGWTVVSGPGSLSGSGHPTASFTVGSGNATVRSRINDGYKLILPAGSTATAYGGPAGAVMTVTAPAPEAGQAFNGWDLRGAADLEKPSERINAPVKLLGGDVLLTPWYLWNASNGYVWGQTLHYATGGSWTPSKIGIAEKLDIMTFAMAYGPLENPNTSVTEARPVTWQRIERSADLGRSWTLVADVLNPANSVYEFSNFAVHIADTRKIIGFSSLGRTMIRSSSFDGLNASMWGYTSVDVVEGQTIIPWATFTRQPQDFSTTTGGAAAFSVVIVGPPQYPNFTYQWLKVVGSNWENVTALVDRPAGNGPGISGATTASLTLTGLQTTDQAFYVCTIADGRTSYMSSRASLIVADPSPAKIEARPENLSKNVGEVATLTVRVSGVPSPNVEWMKAGVVLPGETGTDLRIANLTLADAGLYTVRVWNPTGAPLPAEANLSVTDPNAPGPPTDIQVATITATTVTITWSAPEGNAPVAYAIYRDLSTGPIAIVPAQAGTPLSYIDSALTPGGSIYNYYVVALGASGSQSLPSSSISAATTNGAVQSDTSNTTKLKVHVPVSP